MKFIDWWHRHFTSLGRDIAWRERFARRNGYAYPGHVPPRPMPAPAPAPAPKSRMWGPNINPDPPPRPMGPISLAERAARFQRGMDVVTSLSPECLRMLREDGRILSEVASRVKAEPPRPRHHTMFIVADESIGAGQVVHLDAHADGSFVARVRRIAGTTGEGRQ